LCPCIFDCSLISPPPLACFIPRCTILKHTHHPIAPLSLTPNPLPTLHHNLTSLHFLQHLCHASNAQVDRQYYAFHISRPPTELLTLTAIPGRTRGHTHTTRIIESWE
jgi:hypothetical protein